MSFEAFLHFVIEWVCGTRRREVGYVVAWWRGRVGAKAAAVWRL